MSRSNIPEKLARLGYAARGTVYLIVGGLALVAAIGSGGRATDSKGALQTVLEAPFGAVLLAMIAIGLLCFAAWRLAQGLLDADRLGRKRQAIIRRAAYAASAVIYVGLAFTAVSILLGRRSGSGDESARDWTATLLSQPFGPWLVAAVASAIALGGLAIARRGWTERFDRLALPPAARNWAVRMGRLGFFARAAIFLIVSGFLMASALHANSSEARGLAGALRSLQQQPYGWALLGATALGLVAFGAFQFITAAYRRLDAPSTSDALAEIEAGVQEASRETPFEQCART